MIEEARAEIGALKAQIADTIAKKDKWKRENSRRRHDYVPFLLEAMQQLAKKGKLVSAYEKGKQAAKAEPGDGVWHCL